MQRSDEKAVPYEMRLQYSTILIHNSQRGQQNFLVISCHNEGINNIFDKFLNFLIIELNSKLYAWYEMRMGLE